MIKRSLFRAGENLGWKYERDIGKMRAGFNYSKYLSADPNVPGLEWLFEPKSSLLPDSVQGLRDTWLEKARQLCRTIQNLTKQEWVESVRESQKIHHRILPCLFFIFKKLMGEEKEQIVSSLSRCEIQRGIIM